MLITFGDLKNPPSTLPAKVNLCPTDPKFADLCNRAHQLLLDHGDWYGVVQEANFSILDSCITMPAVVASLDGLVACDTAIAIENDWYRMTPGWNPDRYVECGMHWEFRDLVSVFQQLTGNSVLRVFCQMTSDYGRKIKFLGYDRNGVWVRTRQNGLYQDGESCVLATPFVEPLTVFKNITGVIKDETDGEVRVFRHDEGSASVLTPVGLYQWWETRPQYQRFKVVNYRQMDSPQCCPAKQVTAKVKLAFIKVQYDDDLFLIQNRQAMEYAVQAMKAIDDGNTVLADTLLYGSKDNLRIGAIPLLDQELRTKMGDRFSGNVRIAGARATKRVMCGFI